jgi:hypothetical protein
VGHGGFHEDAPQPRIVWYDTDGLIVTLTSAFASEVHTVIIRISKKSQTIRFTSLSSHLAIISLRAGASS